MKKTIFAIAALLLASQAAFAGHGINRDPADASLDSVQMAAKESKELNADLGSLDEKAVTITISNQNPGSLNTAANGEGY